MTRYKLFSYLAGGCAWILVVGLFTFGGGDGTYTVQTVSAQTSHGSSSKSKSETKSGSKSKSNSKSDSKSGSDSKSESKSGSDSKSGSKSGSTSTGPAPTGSTTSRDCGYKERMTSAELQAYVECTNAK
ncbi:hypothetical protein ACFL2T_04740 [Elusimicrobiota bacterium]